MNLRTVVVVGVRGAARNGAPAGVDPKGLRDEERPAKVALIDAADGRVAVAARLTHAAQTRVLHVGVHRIAAVLLSYPNQSFINQANEIRTEITNPKRRRRRNRTKSTRRENSSSYVEFLEVV